MSEMLRDLYAHQAWACAEHWRALAAHPGALADPAVRERLHHIHLVQRAFLSLARREPVRLTRPEDYPTPEALRAEVMAHHEAAREFVGGLTPERLEERVTIPWFQDPSEAALQVSLEQALTQAAMHSHYHRGQNATRLRELGGEPPLTDLIFWWWKGRPAPRW